jgi:hypothetical protein
MKYLLYLALSITLNTHIAKAQNVAKPADSLSISIYRGSFNESLPEFEIKIYDSGRADYTGIKNAKYAGVKTTYLDTQDLEIFFGTANAMNFFSLENSYTENLFAIEKAIITVNDKTNGKFKKIMRRGKIPRAVASMEDRIIKAVETSIDKDAAKK